MVPNARNAVRGLLPHTSVATVSASLLAQRICGALKRTHREPGTLIVSAKRLPHTMLPKESASSFGRICGAGEGTRTPDPIITNDVLYQLSYTGHGGVV